MPPPPAWLLRLFREVVHLGQERARVAHHFPHALYPFRSLWEDAGGGQAWWLISSKVRFAVRLATMSSALHS